MDMTMSSATPSRVEVVTSVQRRLRWTPEQKLEIVKLTNEPGNAVSMLARPFGITAAQVFQWRKAYLQGSLMAFGANETVVPAFELQEAMRRIKKLDCALASTTLGREVRAVCCNLDLSRIHMMPMRDRPPDWANLRTSPPRNDDAAVKQAINHVASQTPSVDSDPRACTPCQRRPQLAPVLAGFSRLRRWLVL